MKHLFVRRRVRRGEEERCVCIGVPGEGGEEDGMGRERWGSESTLRLKKGRKGNDGEEEV